MAVIISASDEHSASHGRGLFLFAGWVGPEQDWPEFFVPAWQERVFGWSTKDSRSPHTEIRSREFGDQWHLSRLEADARLDEAVAVVDTMGSFYSILLKLIAVTSRTLLSNLKCFGPTQNNLKRSRSSRATSFFLAYAYVVLNYVHDVLPHAEKVDFIVERKGHLTRYIDEFHSGSIPLPQPIYTSSLTSPKG